MFVSLLRMSLMAVVLYGFPGGGSAFAANPTNQAPNFILEGQQKQIELNKYHGKIVYLDFWAVNQERMKKNVRMEGTNFT